MTQEELQKAALDKRRARERRDAETRKADLQVVLNTAAGRRFIWGLIEVDCNASGVGYILPAHDPHGRQHAYNDGRRSIGVDLRDEALRSAPEAYVNMVREMAIDAANRAREAVVPKSGEASTS